MPVLVSGCVWAIGWIKFVFTLSVRNLALMGNRTVMSGLPKKRVVCAFEKLFRAE